MVRFSVGSVQYGFQSRARNIFVILFIGLYFKILVFCRVVFFSGGTNG